MPPNADLADPGIAPTPRASRLQFAVRLGISVSFLLVALYGLVSSGHVLLSVPFVAIWGTDTLRVARNGRALAAPPA